MTISESQEFLRIKPLVLRRFYQPTGQSRVSWLLSTLTQNQLPFSVTLEILDVVMGDGRRS